MVSQTVQKLKNPEEYQKIFQYDYIIVFI